MIKKVLIIVFLIVFVICVNGCGSEFGEEFKVQGEEFKVQNRPELKRNDFLFAAFVITVFVGLPFCFSY